MRTAPKDRLLVISNNVFSNTRSNGKTVLSYFDSLPKERVRQLYFSSEKPSIAGYKYFQISDKDVIKGQLLPNKRGRRIDVVSDAAPARFVQHSSRIKTPGFRLLRELIWSGTWKSPQLLKWLDEYEPTTVFFVGGDSGFAYSICEYIVKKYNARLSVYLTDDYVVPRKKENTISSLRRIIITRKLKKILTIANEFFTISEPMREAYCKMFGKDSHIVLNMTESLKRKEYNEICNNEMMYAGSLYYGRDEVLNLLSNAILQYNEQHPEDKYELSVYTNSQPTNKELKQITVEGVSSYKGSLDKNELIKNLNQVKVLVFVESFNEDEKEKTKYSLSTKVSEYISLEKPILAIGPSEIGSMNYLCDCAICINSPDEIAQVLDETLCNREKMAEFAKRAGNKFKDKHNKQKLQDEFLKIVFGE